MKSKEVFEKFSKILGDEHKKREKRIKDGEDWILLEQQTMQQAVNDIRASLNRPSVSLEDVTRAEIGALGHTDYARKFSLYCAELALEFRNQ